MIVRRPLVLTATAFSLGIIFEYICSMPLAILFVSFFFGVFSVMLLKRKKALLLSALFFTVFCLGGIVFFQENDYEKAANEMPAGRVCLKGEVISAASKQKDESVLIIKPARGRRIRVSIYGKLTGIADYTGRQVVVRGELALPDQRRNPGTFDYRLYLMTQGIAYLMSASPEDIQIYGHIKSPLMNKMALFRYSFEKKIKSEMGREKGDLAAAMLFGDKTGMEENFYERFQRNGTAHILAVSGIHVGIFYAFVSLILGGRRKLAVNIAMMALLFLYAALAGFTPSVMRAVFMIALHIVSNITHYRYDLMSAGSGAALIMLINDPYELFNIGFQMSFLAVFVMATMLPLFKNINMPDLLRNILLPALVIQTGMMPFTAYIFNYFSAGAFLANGAVVFLAGIMIPAGIAAAFLYFLTGTLPGILAAFLDLCSDTIIMGNDIFYMEGKNTFDVTSPPLFVVILFYCAFFFFTSESTRIMFLRRKRNTVALFFIALVLGSWATAFSFDEKYRDAGFIFVDVGQGDCLHIRSRKGSNILIDGGGSENFDVGKKILKPYLLKNGVRKIDLALVTHLDTDHYQGIRSIACLGMVSKIGFYEGKRMIGDRLQRETGMEEEDLIYLHKGHKIMIDGICIEILYPEKKQQSIYREELSEDEENKSSLVIKITVEGYDILMTGDIDGETEEKIVAEYKNSQKLRADILKVSHHGSR
ncbi:MAG TPA: DNA internalization-related competence protein ComEC/Rec2, partial [Bacillota bacterium]|nr:DNA internalization-related competence protein ComEC/Rec2 [Bacillota bacterium]